MLLAERNKLLGYIATIIPDEHLAEDIFQEVSVAAVRKYEQIQSPEHLMGWLRKAARLSALKMRGKPKSPSIGVRNRCVGRFGGAMQEEDGRSSSDEMEMLQKCVQRLQGYPRQLIDLKYGEGLNGAALAERVGRKASAVYVAWRGPLRPCRVRRARAESIAESREWTLSCLTRWIQICPSEATPSSWNPLLPLPGRHH